MQKIIVSIVFTMKVTCDPWHTRYISKNCWSKCWGCLNGSLVLSLPGQGYCLGYLRSSLGPGCSEFFLKVKTVYNGHLRNPQIVFFVALYTLDIFAHNIAIKRYWDKKIKWHFSSNIFFPVGIKNNFLGQF